MANKPKEPEKPKNIKATHYISEELAEKLRVAAFISRRSQNQIIREALEAYLPTVKKEKTKN